MKKQYLLLVLLLFFEGNLFAQIGPNNTSTINIQVNQPRVQGPWMDANITTNQRLIGIVSKDPISSFSASVSCINNNIPFHGWGALENYDLGSIIGTSVRGYNYDIRSWNALNVGDCGYRDAGHNYYGSVQGSKLYLLTYYLLHGLLPTILIM